MDKKLGEFELIDEIKHLFAVPYGVTGIGDDCAILPQRNGYETLVSADLLVEGVHFLMDDISPEQLGWKSVAVNLSDVAAMGGRPIATFLSIALPPKVDDEWVRRFMNGYRQMSELYLVPLLGGDTTRSTDRLCINVTVMGEARKGQPRLRNSARVGDRVCVTGSLGDSAAGLQAILQQVPRDEVVDRLIKRHYEPMPRVDFGFQLSLCEGVHAMMDISDGIGSDLPHILEASGVGATIDVEKIPHSDDLSLLCQRQGWDWRKLAIGGGEDYELLFTLARDTDPGIPYTVIGTITDDKCLRWNGMDEEVMGFRHF